MEQAGGIGEVFPDYFVIQEEIRSKKPDEAESLFGEILLQTIFLRRVETDPAFRWSICIRISSDEILSEMLRRTITRLLTGSEENREEGLLRLRMMEQNPDAICMLFAEETGLPLHYWQTKRAGLLYQTISFPTALQTSPPERPKLLHPMDQAIITSFRDEADAGVNIIDPEDPSFPGRITDAITSIACHSFLILSYEERLSILNRRYPEDGWEPLISALMIFEPSAEALLVGARHCAATHQIVAARSLYSLACSRAEEQKIRQLSYREMGLLSRNIGEHERAFSEFQSALEAARERGEDARSFQDELIYLCEAAEKLGLSAEGDTIFDRLISIARDREGEERVHLLMQIATSCRRSGWFDREYALIEDLIGEEECSDAAFARLDTLNRAMRGDGTLDSALLADLEAGAEAEYTTLRGILAFGAFQFDDALTWFNASVSIQNSPETRLWRARAAWYANKPPIDIRSDKNDQIETQIISGLLRGEKIGNLVRLIPGGGEDEGYDAILVLLEGMRGRSISESVNTVTGDLLNLPVPQEERARLLRILAKVLSECGIPDAVPVFRKALRITTSKEARAGILSEIGYWYETRGQPKKAAEAYMRAVALHQEFPGGWAGVARAYAQQGEYDSAMEAISTAIRYLPDREEYRMIQNLLHNRIKTDGLEPQLQEQIDAIDRSLFTWSGAVPSSIAGRYLAVIKTEAATREEPVRSSWAPEMMAAEEVLTIRNSAIQALLS
ncbi:tetratricopeptide repeat protein [Methanocalculus sp.]|uniref:tetratricopeptide repeat protein n=1 Tax=Methanocalculus sp. TaxID=2004547 RepID=UPI00261CF7D3|nr:tetratricopeptide repeat protein [Methanocalculus sp.]MDG6249896.1 tetratricopeptide repeat protein [Methanocalculus sp.]